jgi:quercetin dioxygenase-like cupin family protein
MDYLARARTEGSIEFQLTGAKTIRLVAGDRMVLPTGTRHAAVVGPDGCTCVEGKLSDGAQA